MKNQAGIFGCALLLVAVITLSASTFQDKNNKGDKGSQKAKPGHSKEKSKSNGGNGSNVNKSANEERGQTGNAGMNNKKSGDSRGKGENADRGNKDNVRDNKSIKTSDNKLKDRGNSDKSAGGGYSWNRENFYQRQQIRGKDKVLICHKFNSNEPAANIRVSSNAVKAHMNHGDIMGECPAVNQGQFSDIFLRNRDEYYTTLYNSQDQVSYSRSILDYALTRLTGSRQQLTSMQNNNYAADEIARKQATVVELEQNVSLLETVLGVASSVIASKLQ